MSIKDLYNLYKVCYYNYKYTKNIYKIDNMSLIYVSNKRIIHTIKYW